MGDHLDQRDGADPYVLEVVRICLPRSGLLDPPLLLVVVRVDAVAGRDILDVVVQLKGLLRDLARRGSHGVQAKNETWPFSPRSAMGREEGKVAMA